MQKLKRIVLVAANALCLCCIFAGLLSISMLRGTLSSQKAAERWRGENERVFAQISAFFPQGSEIKLEKIQSFRGSLESTFVEGGIEAPENGRLWADSYCTIGTANVSSDRGSSAATAIGIGGDYFLFHPLRLCDGQYISESDLMKDRVVINTTLAWKLYGGMELAGMTLTVNGKECIIAGVVETETDFATERALEAGMPMVFLAYERMQSGAESSEETGAGTYEIVLPNLISGYALGIVETGFGSDDAVQIVDNTNRFSFVGIRGVIADFAKRSMQSSPMVYPYWENAARYVESLLAILWILTLLFAILPAITAVVYAVRFFKFGKQQARRGIYAAGERLEARRERRWIRMQEGKRIAGKSNPAAVMMSESQEQSQTDDTMPDVERIIQEIIREKSESTHSDSNNE